MTDRTTADGQRVYWQYGRKRRKADGEVEFKSQFLTVEDADRLREKLGKEWLETYLGDAKQMIDLWAVEPL